ncbi:hypothetical protein DL95DRAFT_250201, partial [Leptodontidium sp. 2 PMI_412]
MLTTQIEIAAPPAVVREKFLQFDQIPKYSPNGFFISLGPLVPGKALEPGVKMHNVLRGATLEAVVLKNSPSEFRWKGEFYGIFNGEHMFQFRESKEEGNKGGTTFVH